MTGLTPNNANTKDVAIAVPLKYISNFWKTLRMPLINCEINPFVIWRADCVFSAATGATVFAIADTKS